MHHHRASRTAVMMFPRHFSHAHRDPTKRLEQAFAAARLAPDGAMPRLKQAVHEFVAEKHAEGCKPEVVIVALKRVAQSAGVCASSPVARRGFTIGDRLITDAVTWATDCCALLMELAAAREGQDSQLPLD